VSWFDALQMLASTMLGHDVRNGALTDFIHFGHFSMAPALLVPIAGERLAPHGATNANHEKRQQLL
jgi:hypothetical protein